MLWTPGVHARVGEFAISGDSEHNMNSAVRAMAGPLVIFANLLAVAAQAEEPARTVSKEEIVARYPGIGREQIQDGPIKGLYELNANGGYSYVTTDGRYLIRGEIIDLETRENLTKTRQDHDRARILAAVDPATEIVFPSKGAAKHRLFVFTDVDCGYCRQFHRQIALVNELGIEVHYLAYPRSGPHTESWAKAEGVWCAGDRNGALTQAKLGADVKAAPSCTSNPVAEQYDLGHRVGVRATPAVFAENGAQLGGFVPAEDLLRLLEEEAGHSKKR
jgi:thiol:disulfide interchange protein DsbC